MVTRSVDDVAEELYAVEPAAFVAARTEAVRAARDAGDSELADVIGKLRRPALAAWAVNLLARDDAAGLTQLVALGGKLREAQQQLQREALQRLSRQRYDVLAALVRRARQLAVDAGHPLGAGAAEQVKQTLGAALADPDAAREVQQGRLVRPLRYVGFGPASAGASVTERPERSCPAYPDVPGEEELAGPSPPSRERLQRELAEARREVAPLATVAQRASDELESADGEVTYAQQQLAAATQRRDAAARRAHAADWAYRDAERRVQELTGQLDGFPPPQRRR